MDEHARGPQGIAWGAVHKHNALPGHTLDILNPTMVFRSDCYYTRVTVEAALIHAAPTVPCNTASASVDADDLVASSICRATKFDWEKLAECIPHLKREAIPCHKRHLFGSDDIVRPPENMRSQEPPPPVAHHTRSRVTLPEEVR